MSSDPGVCGVRWCDETLNHDGPHRKRLFDTFAMDVRTGRPTILQAWLQGESTRTKAVVWLREVRDRAVLAAVGGAGIHDGDGR